MENRPRVGLVLMRAEWPGCGAAGNVLETVEADTRAIVERLEEHFSVAGPWVISSTRSMQEAQHALRDAELDMVLLAFQTWAEDAQLVSLLQAIGSRPLVLWCYLPWRRVPRPVSRADLLRGAGPVGTFGALGTLRNLGVPFFFTFGAPDDPRLMQDLRVAGRAAAVRQYLRKTRFGLIPSRDDLMHVNFVDEFRLMADFGPVVQYVSVSELKRTVDRVTPEQARAYLDQLHECYPVVGVTEPTLEQAAHLAVGLGSVGVDHNFDVVVVNDLHPELLNTFHLRPGLYPNLNGGSGPLYLPGGDLAAATAGFILNRLTGSDIMFMELWFWDEARNQIIGGHAGLQNPVLAQEGQVCVSEDTDFCRPDGTEGAQFQFLAQPGRVTLFQLRSTPQGWQAIAATGVCLEGQPWVEGLPHAILRMDTPIDHFLNKIAAVGASQHWVMAYGSVLHEIEAFCQMLQVPLEIMTL